MRDFIKIHYKWWRNSIKALSIVTNIKKNEEWAPVKIENMTFRLLEYF